MGEKVYGAARLRRAAIHFVTGRAVQALARAALILVIVRILPVADYGAYMLIIGLAEAVLLIASLGIVPVGQRYLPELVVRLKPAKVKRFVLFLLAAQTLVLIVLALATWAGWSALAKLMNLSATQTAATYWAPVLFLLIPCFRLLSEIQEALLEQGRAQIARALMPVGRIIGIGVYMAFDVTPGLAELLLLDIIVTIGCILLAYFNIFSTLGQLAQGTAEDLPVRDMLRFGWHMAGVNLLGSTMQPGVVRLVIANGLGVVETGVYAFLQSLERLVSRYLPGTLLRGLVRPVLVSRAHTEGGVTTMRAGASLLIKANLLMVVPGCLIAAVAGDEVVAAASGGKFTDAGFTLLMFLIVLLVSSQRQVIEMVAQITGQTAMLRATALIGPVTLAAVWLVAPHGLNIIILTLAIGSILSNLIRTSAVMRRTPGFRVEWSGMVRIVVAGAGATLVGELALIFTHAFMASAAGLVAFCVAIFLAKPFLREEVTLVQKGFGKRLVKPLSLLARD